MKAYAIVIDKNETSEKGYSNLTRSSLKVGNEFSIEKFKAVVPEEVENLLPQLGIKWTWPHTGVEFDTKTGIKKIGYGGRDPLRRKACGLSHYLLWYKCVIVDEPILVFEHDAIFNHKLDVQPLLESHFQVIGLNDPHNATRLSNKFHSIVQSSQEEILPVPRIDKDDIAQGIAGNSAYLIKPKAATKLINLAEEHGMWNNDAIMCRQLMPDMIGVTKKYYTTVQKLPSTTMG